MSDTADWRDVVAGLEHVAKALLERHASNKADVDGILEALGALRDKVDYPSKAACVNLGEINRSWNTALGETGLSTPEAARGTFATVLDETLATTAAALSFRPRIIHYKKAGADWKEYASGHVHFHVEPGKATDGQTLRDTKVLTATAEFESEKLEVSVPVLIDADTAVAIAKTTATVIQQLSDPDKW